MEHDQPNKSSKRQKLAPATGESTESHASGQEDHPPVTTLRSALTRRFELLAELSALDDTIFQARAEIKAAGDDVIEPDSLVVVGENSVSHMCNFLDVPSLCCFDQVNKAFREIAKRHWLSRDAALVSQSKSKANNPRARAIMEYRAIYFMDSICSEQQVLDHTVLENPNEKGSYGPKCRGCQKYYTLNGAFIRERPGEFEPFLRIAKGDQILLQGFFPVTIAMVGGYRDVSISIPLAVINWHAADELGRLADLDDGDDWNGMETLLREFGENLTISIAEVEKTYFGFESRYESPDKSPCPHQVYLVRAQSGFRPESFSPGVRKLVSTMWMHCGVHSRHKCRKRGGDSLKESRRNGKRITLLWHAKMKAFSVKLSTNWYVVPLVA